MPFERQSHRSYIALPVVLGAFCVGISLAGYGYYEAQRRNLESDIQSQLSAIADLKTQQILAWRKERQADAERLAQKPSSCGAA